MANCHVAASHAYWSGQPQLPACSNRSAQATNSASTLCKAVLLFFVATTGAPLQKAAAVSSQWPQGPPAPAQQAPRHWRLLRRQQQLLLPAVLVAARG
jgi:hypothetical protein